VGVTKTERFSRQLDICDPDELRSRVLVIGAGGIGSWVVALLSRIGFDDITVYDNDTVDEVNLGYQFFRDSDVGKPKVEALRDFIKDFSGVEITAVNKLYKSGDYKEVVICGVDSMKTRHDIWKQMKMKPQVKCYVDARMGGENLAIYTINPTDTDEIKLYEEQLYPPEEAEEGPCSAKSIMYNVGTIAAFITNNIKKYLLDGVCDKEICFNLKSMSLMRR